MFFIGRIGRFKFLENGNFFETCFVPGKKCQLRIQSVRMEKARESRAVGPGRRPLDAVESVARMHERVE